MSVLLKKGRAVADHLPAHKPAFEFEVGWADDYGRMLAGDWHRTTTSLDDVLETLRSRGRVILHAEAGAGKSTFASRVFRRSLEVGQPAIWVDLRRWSPPIAERWSSLRGEDLQRMAILLHDLGHPPVIESRIRRTVRAHGLLVIVDGLNEITRGASAGVLPVLDAFASRHPQASVLVTDRLTRRLLPGDRDAWRIAGMIDVRSPSSPLPTKAGSRNALIMDLMLRSGPKVETTVGALREEIWRAVAPSRQAYESVSTNALQIYLDGLGRTFTREQLQAPAPVPDDVIDRLTKSQLVKTENHLAFFRHHLFHDHLAAHALANRPLDWSYKAFNGVSFKANAFDVFALLLEELPDSTKADAFVEKLYGWNQYASAYALARGRRLSSISVSPATEVTVLGMLAERRWDPFEATIERVEDSLRLFQHELSRKLLAAARLEEVLSLIEGAAPAVDSETSPDHPWRAWLQIFLGRLSNDELLEMLTGTPFIGWTASNVLRRELLEPVELEKVGGLLGHEVAEIRWRAAHVLGTQPYRAAVMALLDRLDEDRDEWVQYGSVRSLIEIAAREPDARPEIIEQLLGRLPTLRTKRLVLAELEKCLVLREPSEDWPDAVEPLVEELWAGADSIFDQDHYRRVALRVRKSPAAAQ